MAHWKKHWRLGRAGILFACSVSPFRTLNGASFGRFATSRKPNQTGYSDAEADSGPVWFWQLFASAIVICWRFASGGLLLWAEWASLDLSRQWNQPSSVHFATASMNAWSRILDRNHEKPLSLPPLSFPPHLRPEYKRQICDLAMMIPWMEFFSLSGLLIR